MEEETATGQGTSFVLSPLAIFQVFFSHAIVPSLFIIDLGRIKEFQLSVGLACQDFHKLKETTS